MRNPPRLAIHGGAGVVDVERAGGSTAEQQRALREILKAAWERLAGGAGALDVVEFAVAAMEDSEWFNAGRGSVLNRDGLAEMDASIMDGRDRRCGGVAAVTTPRNPIRAARAVMDHGAHVLLAGAGAERFVAERGLECAPPEYFVVELRRRQLGLAQRGGRISLDHDEAGTVGAVARDSDGNLAAATSTGGMTNKAPGRVGDSPLIGAGTWADNQTCAVSTTGTGEELIRALAAYDVHARLSLSSRTLTEAAAEALATVAALGGSAGLIALAPTGEPVLAFNSGGMFRGWSGPDGRLHVAIK